MNKTTMDKDLLSTSSHVVLHSQMPKLTKESYIAIIKTTANWVNAAMQMWQKRHEEMLRDRGRS